MFFSFGKKNCLQVIVFGCLFWAMLIKIFLFSRKRRIEVDIGLGSFKQVNWIYILLKSIGSLGWLQETRRWDLRTCSCLCLKMYYIFSYHRQRILVQMLWYFNQVPFCEINDPISSLDCGSHCIKPGTHIYVGLNWKRNTAPSYELVDSFLMHLKDRDLRDKLARSCFVEHFVHWFWRTIH